MKKRQQEYIDHQMAYATQIKQGNKEKILWEAYNYISFYGDLEGYQPKTYNQSK